MSKRVGTLDIGIVCNRSMSAPAFHCYSMCQCRRRLSDRRQPRICFRKSKEARNLLGEWEMREFRISFSDEVTPDVPPSRLM
jgi:hypothetical protein